LAAGAFQRSGCRLDNHPAFPDVCAKPEKWFRHQENCFVGAGLTKQDRKNTNDFSRMRRSFMGPKAIAGCFLIFFWWTSALAVRGP